MKTGSLRELIGAREFLHMPAVYDPLGGLLVQNSGFKVCFVGGYVTGAALAISEPLLTMTEQVALAGGRTDGAGQAVAAEGLQPIIPGSIRLQGDQSKVLGVDLG
jgi:hypothetical protein